MREADKPLPLSIFAQIRLGLSAKMSSPHAIILFDGVWNLCTWTVQFIALRDPRGYFQFASLQSSVAQELVKKYHIDGLNADSVVVIEDRHAYLRSDAALHIARQLNGGWSLAWSLRFLPGSLRDFAYDWIAAHRYQLFGRRDRCLISIPNAQERFLDIAS